MAETTGEFDLFAPTTGWRPDPTAAERNARGAALCRSMLADRAAGGPLDPDDPIRDRALRRARDERQAAGHA